METVKSNLEHVEDDNAAIATQHDQHLAEAVCVLRARKHGAIPLDALLTILAGESYREAGRGPAMFFELYKADREFDDGYRILLRHAKRGILSGDLIVRQMPTLARVNEFPVMQTWCNSNDTLLSYDEIRPDSRLVVKIEDAMQWLQQIGVPVPEWLRVDIEAPAENDAGKVLPSGLVRSTRDSSKLATLAAFISLFPKNKQPSAKDLEKAAAASGVEISDDTIRNVLAEARGLAPKLLPK